MTKEPRYLDIARRRISSAFDYADRYLSRRIHVADRQNEHAAMLKAALKRDADAAIKALTQHMQKTSNIVLKAGAAAPAGKLAVATKRKSMK